MGWISGDEALVDTNKWLEQNAQEAEQNMTAVRAQVEKLYAAANSFDQLIDTLDKEYGKPPKILGEVNNRIDKNVFGTFESDPLANTVFTANDDFITNVVHLQTTFDANMYGNLPAYSSPEFRQALREITSTLQMVEDLAGKISDMQIAYDAEIKKDETRAANAARAAIGANVGRQGNQMSAGPTAKKVEEAKKAKKQVEAAAAYARAGGLGARIRTGNYLSKAFREQCYIQANLTKLIELQNKEGISSGRGLPYVDNGGGSQDELPTSNRALKSDLEPFGFVNTLVQSPQVGYLFDAPTPVISQLQPSTRFYKIISTHGDSGAKKGAEREIPIIFPSATRAGDIESIFNNKKRRGYGVGVKSFEWTYDGSNPFAVNKSIKAKLQIYATTMAELLTDRGGYRYADLALKTGKNINDDHPLCGTISSDMIMSQINSLDFRLKAVVGYATPHNLGLSRIDSSAYQSAIHDSFVTLELTPTIHTFDFDEQGQVVFTIEYLAYIEDFFDDYYYNIFPTPQGVARRIALKQAARTGEKPAEPYDPDLVKDEQIESLSKLIGSLFQRNLIYYLRLPWAKMEEAILDPGSTLPVFNADGNLANPNAVANEITNKNAILSSPTSTSVSKEAAKETLKDLTVIGATDKPSDVYNQLGFFYLVDLVNIVLANIDMHLSTTAPETLSKAKKANEKLDGHIVDQETIIMTRMYENFKKLRIMLGPLEIRNPGSHSQLEGDFRTISMGSVPISLTYFIEWMTDKLVAKGRTGYTLTRFLNDFIKSYVRNFLNNTSCRGDTYSQNISIYGANISSYAIPPGRDEISSLLLGTKISRSGNYTLGSQELAAFRSAGGAGRPVLNTMGSLTAAGPRTLGQNSQYNYMIFYGGRSQPQQLMTGNKTLDHSRGIFHYILGKDRGLIKNIRLDRTEVKGHKEMRFEQEGYDGLSQLREVYNVTIDSYMLPNVFPGTYLFVDPRGFAPDTKGYEFPDPENNDRKRAIDQFELSRYGVGGYYMATKVTNRIAEGDFSTQIVANWTAQIEKGRTSAPSTGGSDVESDPDKTKLKKCQTRKKFVFPEQQIGGENASNPTDTVGRQE